MDRENAMQMEGEVSYDKLFRNAIGGFNKDDVLNYLERMAKSRRKENERYTTHVQKLDAQIAQLQAQLAEAEKESGEAAEAAEPAEMQQLRQQQALMEDENSTLKMQKASLEEALRVSREDTRQAEEALCLAKEEIRRLKDAAGREPATPVMPQIPHDTPELIELRSRCALLESQLQSQPQSAPAAPSREVMALQVKAMQDTLREVSEHLDETTRAIYTELSECGTRYSQLRRAADDLRVTLSGFTMD